MATDIIDVIVDIIDVIVDIIDVIVVIIDVSVGSHVSIATLSILATLRLEPVGRYSTCLSATTIAW